ncbi:hypothetical protein A2U01_0004729 [Trifolium medium]|uniref:Uncharacterized protein n=1 Tax=Trifolium medium TaxID=97028 RepID=A0A392M9F0_9FABA|nr:hypothetical protein [Trifolium medium]
MHVFLGDMSEALIEEFLWKVMDELDAKYGRTYCDNPKLYQQYRDVADTAVYVELRNRIMTNRLWKHAENYSSILALVGADHLVGMRHIWHMMKLPCLGIGEGIEYFEKKINEEFKISL